jgi:hypothetical protein
MSVNMNLPVKQGDDFVGELETMDLSELKGKQFIVAVNKGDRSDSKFLCGTIRGPFSFEEMCEATGVMWREHQHHAKVVVLQKDLAAAPKFLDENTVDYIEAHFEDIITESMLDGVFDDQKDFTCRAGVVEGDNSENPFAAENQKSEEISDNIEDPI